MKHAWIIALLAGTACSFGQRDFTPNSRKDAFGKRDFRNLSYTGWQIQLGPTYTFTRLKNETREFNGTSSRGDFLLDPSGRPGFFGELGLVHVTKKGFLSYFDWGIGFKYLGGKETIKVNYRDIVGNLISEAEEAGRFYNGHLYGRITAHKEIHFKKIDGFYIDNGLGANVDYRLITDDQESDYHQFSAQFGTEAYYYKPLAAQIHYDLGFGFKLRRGTNLVVGCRTPILGIHEWNKAKPSLRWFSSNYWPAVFYVKVMNLFQKRRKNSCPPVETNEEDRKRNDEFMQGN